MALVVCGVRTTLAADECITPNGLLVPVTQYLSRLVASSDAAVTVSRTVATERQITVRVASTVPSLTALLTGGVCRVCMHGRSHRTHGPVHDSRRDHGTAHAASTGDVLGD
jgi:hypothetical protein